MGKTEADKVTQCCLHRSDFQINGGLIMKLRCYLKEMKCPPYEHTGVFQADNQTVKRLLPDLKRCANCTACSRPNMPDFRDDLQQIASITLCERGPNFN